MALGICPTVSDQQPLQSGGSPQIIPQLGRGTGGIGHLFLLLLRRPVDVIVRQIRRLSGYDGNIPGLQIVVLFVGDRLALEQIGLIRDPLGIGGFIRQRLSRQQRRCLHISVDTEFADTGEPVFTAGDPEAHILSLHRLPQRHQLR